MNNWQRLDDNKRIFYIENISRNTELSPDAIEKDWWVTMALRALFSCECADHIVFKVR